MNGIGSSSNNNTGRFFFESCTSSSVYKDYQTFDAPTNTDEDCDEALEKGKETTGRDDYSCFLDKEESLQEDCFSTKGCY